MKSNAMGAATALLIISTAACATTGPTGQAWNPTIDQRNVEQARYAADLAECRSYAEANPEPYAGTGGRDSAVRNGAMVARLHWARRSPRAALPSFLCSAAPWPQAPAAQRSWAAWPGETLRAPATAASSRHASKAAATASSDRSGTHGYRLRHRRHCLGHHALGPTLGRPP